MDKAVLISIRPQWTEKIARGEKTIEVRKTRPKLDTPFKCYIYQTGEYIPSYVLSPYSGRRKPGKVMAEFTCDVIFPITVFDNGGIQNWNAYSLKEACMSYEDMADYIGHGKQGYGWRIADLKIYDEPKEPSDFYRWWNDGDDIRPCQNGKWCQHIVYDYSENCQACAIDFDGTDCPYLKVTRPPQSWCYVEGT